MTADPSIIRRIVAAGRVQGVGYRAFIARVAGALNVAGWVRNRRDGTVELVVCGPGSDVAQLIADCRRGPAGARVDRLEVLAVGVDALQGHSERFAVRPTD